jgi:hypothetical protein
VGGLAVDRERRQHGLQQAHEAAEHGQAAQVAVDLEAVKRRLRTRVRVRFRVGVRVR